MQTRSFRALGLAGCFLILAAAPAFGKGMFGGSWDVAFPLGELEGYVNKTSLKGFGVEYRQLLTKNWSVGGAFRYNLFNTTSREQIFLPDRSLTVTGVQDRIVNSYQMLVNGHYYLVKSKAVVPYAGLNIGANYLCNRLEIGVGALNDYTWHFVCAPEVGALIKLGYTLSANISLRYSYAVPSGDSGETSYLGLNVGLMSRALDELF